MKLSRHALDASAIGLSGLCLIHCLALPLAAVALPFLGAWSKAEWVHLVFVALAAPLSGLALLRGHHDRPRALLGLAAAGLGLLFVGAIGWAGEAWETTLTVIGGLLLASAHGWNWLRQARSHAAPYHNVLPS